MVAHGTRERSRIARTTACERKRLVVEAGLLRRGEPFAFLARRRRDQVGKDLATWHVRILLRDSPERGEVRAAPIGAQPVAPVRLVDQTGREQDLLAYAVHAAVRRPRATACLGVTDRLGLLSARDQRLYLPTFIRPDRVDSQNVDDFVVALCAEESTETGRSTVEVSVNVGIRTPRVSGDAHKSVALPRRELTRRTQVSPVVAEAFDIGYVVRLVSVPQTIEPSRAAVSNRGSLGDNRYELSDRVIDRRTNGA